MPRWKAYKYGEWAAAAHRRAAANRPQVIAVDTETTGLGWFDTAFCVTLTWPDRAAGGLYSTYIDLESDESGTRAAIVKQILAACPRWVFHNAKFDLQKLAMHGCLPPNWRATHAIEDTATIYALINENDSKRLKHLAQKILGESTNEDKILAKVRRKLKLKKDDGYHLLPRNVVAPYAMKDTEYTLRLYQALRPVLNAEDVVDLYNFEIGLELDLLLIEGNGIGLNMPYVDKTASEYGVKVMRGQAALVKLTGKEGFNANSPKQILEAFAARGIELEATDKATLGELSDELATRLLEYRSDKKLHATYLLAMQSEQRDGVIHPNFNLTTPRTGRMSSGAATNN